MKVAVNTRFLLSHKMEGFGWYTFEILKRIVENHPEHEFVFFFDRAYDRKFVFGKNVTPVILKPQARHPFLFYYWFEVAVKNALIEHKADLFFSPDGYLSLKTEIPQIAVIHDINFEHNPKDLPWLMLRYYKYFFPKFAQKATRIITVSEFSRKDIIAKYHIAPQKIQTVWNGASEVYQPITDEQKQIIREKYTNGFPYFLFVGALHPRKNVRRLIDAFLKLKEMDENDKHQLVIVGAELWNNALGPDNIPGFLRHHIHFVGHLQIEELAQVMGAASALTYVSYFEGFGIPLVEAMRCGTPILAGNKTSLPEVAGDAALYCDPYNVDDIAEKMIALADSPELREELSKKGLERSTLFSWDRAAEEVWQVITNAQIHSC